MLAFPLMAGFVLSSTTHDLLTSPDRAVACLTLGILLICREFNAPGTIFPGCAGLFAFLYASFALCRMHLHLGSVALLAVAFFLIAFDVKRVLRGKLAAIALIAVILALHFLIVAPFPPVHWPVAIAAGFFIAVPVTSLWTVGEQARRAKMQSAADTPWQLKNERDSVPRPASNVVAE